MKSPKRSLKGWNIYDWFKGNWGTIKEAIKVLLPLGIVWSQTHNPALIGIFTLGGKFILDLGHYYFKEQ